jgi:transposase-like protein
VRVNGRWCYLYRAIDREDNLIDARLSATRDMGAAQRFFAQALGLAGAAPAQVTTDGHDAYPRHPRDPRRRRHPPHEPLQNNRIEQDHRGVKQRHYPMRGFGSFLSAARFCVGFEEQSLYFLAPAYSGDAVALAERRRRFGDRWAAVIAELAAA